MFPTSPAETPVQLSQASTGSAVLRIVSRAPLVADRWRQFAPFSVGNASRDCFGRGSGMENLQRDKYINRKNIGRFQMRRYCLCIILIYTLIKCHVRCTNNNFLNTSVKSGHNVAMQWLTYHHQPPLYAYSHNIMLPSAGNAFTHPTMFRIPPIHISHHQMSCTHITYSSMQCTHTCHRVQYRTRTFVHKSKNIYRAGLLPFYKYNLFY